MSLRFIFPIFCLFFSVNSWSGPNSTLLFSTSIDPFSTLYCARLGIRATDKYDLVRAKANYHFIHKRYDDEYLSATTIDRRMMIENKILLLDVAYLAIRKERSFIANTGLDKIRERLHLTKLGIQTAEAADAFSQFRINHYGGTLEDFMNLDEKKRVESLLHFGYKAGSESMKEAIPLLLARSTSDSDEVLLNLFWSVEDANFFLGDERSFKLALSTFRTALDQHLFVSKAMLLTREEVYLTLKNTQRLIVLLGKAHRQNSDAVAMLEDFAYWYESRLLRFAGIPKDKWELLYLDWTIAKKSKSVMPKSNFLSRVFTDCNSALRGMRLNGFN